MNINLPGGNFVGFLFVLLIVLAVLWLLGIRVDVS